MNEERRKTLLKLVRPEPCDSQNELSFRLRKLGLPADQAIVSRELRALGIAKVIAPDGKERYVSPDQVSPSAINSIADSLKILIQKGVVSDRLVLLKTKSAVPWLDGTGSSS